MSGSKQKAFNWVAVDESGKKTKGEVRAESLSLAKAQLAKKGIHPKKIKARPKEIIIGSPYTPSEIAMFSRQLSTMLTAGVPLMQALEITEEGIENRFIKDMVVDIRAEVSGGEGFSKALAKFPKAFDSLYCSLVSTGELSGTLDQMLARIADYQEKNEHMKKQIKKALKYPTTVMCFAVVVTAVLLMKVVPTFASIFEDQGAELPALTQLIVTMSDFLVAHWYKVIGAILALYITFKVILSKSQKARNFKDRASLKIPKIGIVLIESQVARFARVLTTTFSAGVPVVEALDSVQNAADNIVFKEAISAIQEEVKNGGQLHHSIKNTGVFPLRLSQMVSIGEEAGALDEMLSRVADYYEIRVEDNIEGVTAMIEPFMMAFLAVVIGTLMIAMYLPLFGIGQAF
jgi:type IV pilus assembly protein PilC